MLLALDVGNTNLTVGIYSGEKLKISWRIVTERSRTEDEYGILLLELIERGGLNKGDITDIIIASVVPAVDLSLEKMSGKYFSVVPLIVNSGTKTGIRILIDNPQEVGADRIANTAAAFTLYGGPLIVVDFGTATTFDVINSQGDYLGGAIAPGIEISAEALFKNAAKLPRIELTAPRQIIGRSTIESMQSGIIYGFAGQVDGIVTRMSNQFITAPGVIATGGLANLIAEYSETIERINPFLTLEGLKIIYKINKKD